MTMINGSTGKKIKEIWAKHDTTIVLILLLAIFMFYATFIALKIKTGIIPDEVTHYIFSKHFSTTLGIPPDVAETIARGVFIKHRPFIYYWINGRIINVLNMFWPSISYWQIIKSLRIINVFYALGTAISLYLLSKELIRHKWGQLVPVFLLTNTIMFVFLAGGVNYDNLANLFSMAGLYFLARVFNQRSFLTNSLAWLICIALGTLTKFTVLPLALAMGVAWIIFFIKNHKQILPLKAKGKIVFGLSFLLFLLIIGNLLIYGYNLVVYQELLPACEDFLTKEQCSTGIFQRRLEREGLEQKLTVSDSKKLGYPGPVEYFFTDWVFILFARTYGVLGHRLYISGTAVFSHLFLFSWILLLSLIYWRDFSIKYISFIGILFGYLLVLYIKNYNVELIFGFKHYALQGRYIFPVIGIAYSLVTNLLLRIPRNRLRRYSLIITFLIYFLNGPLIFLLHQHTHFLNWFFN